jgi:hypothetical protein
VPILTCGLATFVMVLVGAYYVRSRWQALAGVGYFLLTGVALTTADGTGVASTVGMLTFLLIWFGGIAHVAVLQTRVLRMASAGGFPSPVNTNLPADPAIVAAQWRAHRRQEARALLAKDPALAAELRIGRPDAPARQYDDGGLVDVNHVPAQLLAAELELSPSLAAALVAERERLGGYGSPEELLVYCPGLTPQRLEIIRDRLVFVPV